MKHKIVIVGYLVLMSGLLSGCAALLVGGVAGYKAGPDSVKARVHTSYDRTYDASLETIRTMGGISEDRKSEGWVKCKVEKFNIGIHLVKFTDSTVEITVSARKDTMPQAQYAQGILAKILIRIEQQPTWMR